MKAKRSLGQNFLENKSVLQTIAAAVASGPSGTIIEIGPGHGELTGELLKYPVSVIAIEKDDRLIDGLCNNFQFSICNLQSNPDAQFPKRTVVSGDALKILPELVQNSKFKIQNSGYKVVGNIPYYITGHLLRVLSELEPQPGKIVLLVQKEVAERVCARPPQTNLLSASVQFWTEPSILMHIGRKNFHPVPKVDSAVLELAPRRTPTQSPEEIGRYYSFIRALFKQPRKTILNNLRTYDPQLTTKIGLAERLMRLGVDPGGRPQDLGLPAIVKLARSLKSAQNV